MTKKILLTRPVQDSVNTKKKLEKIGLQAVIIPFIKICKFNHVEIPVKKYDLIIFTSKNAAKFFANKLHREGVIFSIGEGTTDILKKKKFQKYTKFKW